VTLTIETAADADIALVEGWESRFYLHKRRIPVLEVRLPVPSQVRTIVEYA
jgi:hypothetical protein